MSVRCCDDETKSVRKIRFVGHLECLVVFLHIFFCIILPLCTSFERIYFIILERLPSVLRCVAFALVHMAKCRKRNYCHSLLVRCCLLFSFFLFHSYRTRTTTAHKIAQTRALKTDTRSSCRRSIDVNPSNVA